MSSWIWPNSFRLSGLQDQISALLLELSMGPGSLYSEVTKSPPNLDINPEMEWDAEVRLGEDIPLSERAFLEERRGLTKKAFAQLMGVEESEVDDRDIPVVAIAGSGGGG
jgi:phospholipase A2